MFEKILIANRGEIACRIIKTARRMGIGSVAVYSSADVGALHVHLADEAVEIGPAPARDSYLRSDRIVEAARATHTDAIHPGYGFLAENAAFAQACVDAGLVFIGPPAAAIERMGSKSAAKAIMNDAGVPVVPGYFGADQADATLEHEAAKVGYPVLIKASAGGGGKGMRVVEKAEDFRAALDSARREAASAFGDERMLLEKYLLTPRHIEIQVFCDAHGGSVSMFERDCSVQRRHQKVLEEAPAPGLSAERRQAMGAAAVAAAQAVGYRNAGTVEFIVDSNDDFYFMEMNTRLQVEHAVTELVTGQDLVEWQIRIAAGEPLPCQQQELELHGHAIEVRLYAEDPTRDFLPATGQIAHLRFPAGDNLVRIDTGVRSGDEVSVHYDPLLAKVIAWGPDRRQALTRLRGALRATELVGVTTNREFLLELVGHAEMRAGGVDTEFISRHIDSLIVPAAIPDDTVLAIATLSVVAERGRTNAANAMKSEDPYSPWDDATIWRMNGEGFSLVEFQIAGERVPVTVRTTAGGYRLTLPGGEQSASVSASDGNLTVLLSGQRLQPQIVGEDRQLVVILNGTNYPLSLFDPAAKHADAELATGRLTAPMPGTVVKVLVEPGSHVVKGAALMVLEAMKMEHTITAPGNGIVSAIHFKEGDLVSSEGLQLLDLKI